MLVTKWADVSGIQRFGKMLSTLAEGEVRKIGNRAVNRTGDMARTQVCRVLPKQTGLPRTTIIRAVRVTRSSPHTLAYTMSAKGGDVALKFFKARETRAGVSAAPFGKRKVFAGTFIKGGRFPNRSGIVFHGHVMRRAGAARFPIKVEQSGVVIPAEMVSGATLDAFERTVREVLPRRVDHELGRLLRR